MAGVPWFSCASTGMVYAGSVVIRNATRSFYRRQVVRQQMMKGQEPARTFLRKRLVRVACTREKGPVLLPRTTDGEGVRRDGYPWLPRGPYGVIAHCGEDKMRAAQSDGRPSRTP